MMKFLRKKGVMKILLWGIAIVVILSFGILSNAYLLSEQGGSVKHAGTVFGRKVSLEDFQRNYQFVLIQAQLQYGNNFDKILPLLKLNEQTWDRIILLEEARRQRISVADKDVVETISNIPFFHNQKTGIFDPAIYEMMLTRGLRISVRAFEEGIRDSLKINRLFDRQTFTASVSEEEITAAYKEANERVRVSYILFPSEDFLDQITFDEIKAKSYFMDHKTDFLQPASINAVYIKFPFTSNDADSKNQAYEKSFAALDALKDEQDILAIAKNHGAETGETGFFNLDKPVLAMGWPHDTFTTLFSMREGQSTEIITTSDSYDIIQIKETRLPFIPGYEQVKDDVRTAWIKDEAMNLSRKAAEEKLAFFTPDTDFEKTAKAQGLNAAETPDFKRGQYLPDIGPDAEFQETAFSLTSAAPIGGPVRTQKGFAILHLNEYIPVNEEKYAEEKDAFRIHVLEQKKMDIFNRYFETLRKKAGLEDLISEHLKR